jgi:hypothetical protein
MSAGVNIKAPIFLMLAVVFGTALAIAVLIVFSGAAPGGAGVSTAVVSTANTYENLLPFAGAMTAAGLVLAALASRR